MAREKRTTLLGKASGVRGDVLAPNGQVTIVQYTACSIARLVPNPATIRVGEVPVSAHWPGASLIEVWERREAMTTPELRTEVYEVAELVLDQCRCSTDPDFTALVTLVETTMSLVSPRLCCTRR